MNLFASILCPSDDLPLLSGLHVSERQCNASTRVDLSALCSPQPLAAKRGSELTARGMLNVLQKKQLQLPGQGDLTQL